MRPSVTYPSACLALLLCLGTFAVAHPADGLKHDDCPQDTGKPVATAAAQGAASAAATTASFAARAECALPPAVRQAAGDDKEVRARLEARRLEQRRRCTQNPRACDGRNEPVDPKKLADWRDKQGEGESTH